LIDSNNIVNIKSNSLEMTMKGFINIYFFTDLSNNWNLEFFILEKNRPEYAKKNCLYLYKESLQNIYKSFEFDNLWRKSWSKLIKKIKKNA